MKFRRNIALSRNSALRSRTFIFLFFTEVSLRDMPIQCRPYTVCVFNLVNGSLTRFCSPLFDLIRNTVYEFPNRAGSGLFLILNRFSYLNFF
jgi:hypothetical protein